MHGGQWVKAPKAVREQNISYENVLKTNKTYFRWPFKDKEEDLW